MGAPQFLGEIWAPNLTADPQAGIGGWTDGQLARLLRNGLGREGRYAGTMPRFARLADQDVAALIGFLRSNDPLVAPSSNQVPRLGLGLAGTLALAFAAGVDTGGDAHVPMPPRGPTADYGRYLAATVYGCVDCHTDGFKTTDENLRSPVLLAGGLFLRTPRGDPVYSTNLTPDPETGIAAWSADDLARTLTTGIGRAGLPLRPPMPVFRYVDADESAALFAYLRSVPAVNRRTPGAPRERATPDAPPALCSPRSAAPSATASARPGAHWRNAQLRCLSGRSRARFAIRKRDAREPKCQPTRRWWTRRPRCVSAYGFSRVAATTAPCRPNDDR